MRLDCESEPLFLSETNTSDDLKTFLTLRLYRACATFPYLQGDSSACSIKVAYQAVEANHPGLGREGLPLTDNSPGETDQFSLETVEKSNIGKGITPGDVDRSVPIHATG